MTKRIQYCSMFSLAFSRRFTCQAIVLSTVAICAGFICQSNLSAAEITTGTWTWQAGEDNQSSQHMPVYGEQGVPDVANRPGQRSQEARWTNSTGDTWVFGGYGFAENDYGTLNDFWKYDAETGYWTWLGGSKDVYAQGSFGTQGVASPDNFPPSRADAATWLDASGNLWMYGGMGSEGLTGVGGKRGDLWKYDVAASQWIWINGEQAYNPPAVEGILGTPDPVNTPGGLAGNVSWHDNDGALWLFGGADSVYKNRNDLWKFDPLLESWTHVKAGTSDESGNHGIKGSEDPLNVPPSINLANTWVDSSGNLWMFGGIASNFGFETWGDLWRYNPIANAWTWMSGTGFADSNPTYGMQGTPSIFTDPGSRYQCASWIDNNDNLWIFGGYADDLGMKAPYLNDLWKFDISTAKWTWMKGSKTPGSLGTTGTLETGDSANNPAARYKPDYWKSTSNTFNVRGGQGISLDLYALLHDSWSYDINSNNWTWLGGDYDVIIRPDAFYGVQGEAAPDNTPGPRTNSITWETSDGKLWLYGGKSEAERLKADLWSFDRSTKLWTWEDGTTESLVSADYGALGIPAPENTPGSKSRTLSWVDENDNLWLFQNSLWKYDMAAHDWACMDAGTTNGLAVYGEKGVTDETNSPGLRENAAMWQDNSGHLWLFGGYGKPTGSTGRLNDLWKYDISSGHWTWITGTSDINSTGTYGLQGIEAPDNSPSARQNSTAWLALDGSLLLYGGEVAAGMHFGDDLWKFDPESGNWTWLAGSDQQGQPANYGELGIEAPANTPGARGSTVAWTDPAGDLWLFGGEFRGDRQLADIWKYSIASRNWTWMGGSQSIKAGGVYGTEQVASADNFPGARTDSAVWVLPDYSLWLYGGHGMDDIGGSSQALSDMWQFTPIIPDSRVDWNTVLMYQ